MSPLAAALAGTIGGLILLLGFSEIMVRSLTQLGSRLGLSQPLLGSLVALGGDAPEISTAVLALAAGSQAIGLGVVEGSNLFNLAALIGLSTLVIGGFVVSRPRVVHDGGANLVLTIIAVILVAFEPSRAFAAIAILLVFAGYLISLRRGARLSLQAGPRMRPALVALLSTAAVVASSALVVNSAIALVHLTGIPPAVIGILILPIATSLPNAWGALSLARKGLGDAVFATAINSNSLNLVFGMAVPSLLVSLRPGTSERLIDGPFLLLSTIVASGLIFARRGTSRLEGAAIILVYMVFLAVRFGLIAR
ncbi:MAG: sodium:calcium antiporter [Chloroflexota bacterium]